MSALLPFMTANRSLAEAFAFEANECGDEPNALLLTRISAAYSRSANDLEAKIRAAVRADPDEPL